ncbi:MAG TPA: hypothetical protein VFG49_08865 [Dyella sp.]|uniref:hypothetical protein n=1 Tax=Dyella sp. TaxID=1869338 RepID=UPI002D766293|nr:hypothetical protein [Dyella sp.]HET6553635.1 hypothetical protein [Dyella sp.]
MSHAIRHYMVSRSLRGLSWLAWLLPACLAHGQQIDIANERDPSVAKQLEAGQRLLKQGIPDTAISKYFDPIIRSYESKYRRPGVVVYSAHSNTEALLYSVMRAAAGADGQSSAQVSTIVLDGAWADALELKAYELVEMQRDDEALKVLQEAIQLAPSWPVVWAELGNIYQTRRQWADAADAYQQVESAAELMEEGDAKIAMKTRGWRGQGYVLTETNRLDEAEAMYRKCLALDPNDSGSRNELAYIQSLREKSAPSGPQTPAPQ